MKSKKKKLNTNLFKINYSKLITYLFDYYHKLCETDCFENEKRSVTIVTTNK